MKWKVAISVLTGLILLAAAGLFLTQNQDRLHAKARKGWKEQAVADITRRASDAAWLAAETNSLKAKAMQDPSDETKWFSDHVILMRNGEWLIYASKCSKEDRRIHDIFVARASDGNGITPPTISASRWLSSGWRNNPTTWPSSSPRTSCASSTAIRTSVST